MRGSQRPKVESLRCLHRNQIPPIDRLGHSFAGDSFDGVTNRNRWDHAGNVARLHPRDHPPDDVGGQQRTRSIVDEHQSVLGGNLLEPCGHRILPPITSANGAVDVADLEGKTVQFRSPSYGDQRFDAKVFSVGAIIDPTTRAARLMAIADNTRGSLKPGMFVEIEITVEYVRYRARAVVAKKPFFDPERKRG